VAVLRERTASVGQVRTRVLDLPGDGPPLLLLHGYSDTAVTWRPLLRVLAERGRRAIAVDLPGFGEADRLAGYADRFASGPMLPAIDRFAAALVREAADDGPRPVLVGNSLGAVAALRAAQDPDLPLAGTIAISPAGFGHQPWVDFFEREPVIHRIANAPIPLPTPLIRFAVRTLYPRVAVHDRSSVDRSLLSAYAAQYRSRGDVARVVRDARRLLGELRTPYDVSRICRPVTLVLGARDLLTPPRGARALLDSQPGVELVELARCGHCAQVERPERVADIAVEFADRVGA
jgi:pimeloyl-ACP methyl ester carboxylesterase